MIPLSVPMIWAWEDIDTTFGMSSVKDNSSPLNWDFFSWISTSLNTVYKGGNK